MQVVLGVLSCRLGVCRFVVLQGIGVVCLLFDHLLSRIADDLE